MKIAEEILNEQKFGFSKEQKECALNAMKIYSNQKLDEAALLLNTNSSTELWQEEILFLKDEL